MELAEGLRRAGTDVQLLNEWSSWSSTMNHPVIPEILSFQVPLCHGTSQGARTPLVQRVNKVQGCMSPSKSLQHLHTGADFSLKKPLITLHHFWTHWSLFGFFGSKLISSFKVNPGVDGVPQQSEPEPHCHLREEVKGKKSIFSNFCQLFRCAQKFPSVRSRTSSKLSKDSHQLRMHPNWRGGSYLGQEASWSWWAPVVIPRL